MPDFLKGIETILTILLGWLLGLLIPHIAELIRRPYRRRELRGAFIEEMVSAYDTEKRFQEQELAPAFSIEDVVIEAGPTYFESAAKQVEEGIESVAAQLGQRSTSPYTSATIQ